MATIAVRSPGRDAELQQAFVVIKTECQAEEGWQWIKASLCVSQHVHVFQGEHRFVPQRLILSSFKFVLRARECVAVAPNLTSCVQGYPSLSGLVSPDWM